MISMVSLSLFFFFLTITGTDSFLFPVPPWRGIRQLLAIGPWGHILDNIKPKRKEVLWIDPSDAETAKLIHSSKLPPCKHNHRRIVSTSDTHGKHRFVHVPPCDIFIHSGDILQRYGYFGNFGGGLTTLKDFVSWLNNPNLVPAKHGIVVIGGNHDILLEQMGQENIQSIFDDYVMPTYQERKKCYYIENGAIDICDLSIYGSPWSPIGVTDNLAFQSGTNASHSVGLATAAAVTTNTTSSTTSSSAACDDDTTSSKNIDILMTHASCKEWERIIQNSYTKLWVHGHWHDGQGKINQIFHNGHKEQEQSFCISVNVASNDMIYRPKNPPIVIDIPISKR